MVTASNISTNTSSSGRTYISGTASGLDTASLIKAAVAQRTQEATTLSATITTNQTKISAYQTLLGQVNDLETALDALKNSANNVDSTNSASASVQNAFSTKSVTVSSSDSTINASNVLSATATGSTTAGTHTIVVNHIAQTEQVTSSVQNSTSTALGYSGSFSLNIDGKTAAAINITAGQNLSDIKDAINAQSTTTGVTADILQTASGSYKLVLSGTDTNKSINVSGVSGDDVLQNLGITDNTGAFVNISQPAQGASITFDNTPITSDTNSFSSILSGLDINLQSAAPNSTITLKIDNNTSGVQTAINNLIKAYNALSDTITANHQVNVDGSVNSSETLYGDSVMNSLGQALNKLIAGSGNNSSQAYNSLGALGLTINGQNHLVISNQTALNNALNNHFADVQSFFASSGSTDNPALTIGKNSSSLNKTFGLTVTVDSNGVITGTSVDSNTTNFTISGSQLIGKTGTDYAGLTLNYTGITSTINVTVQQGWADQLLNLLDNYANTNSGIFVKQVKIVQDNDTSLQQRISKINSDATVYENMLIDKYARMEAAVEKAQLAQKRIEAISGFLNSSSSSTG